MQTVTVRTHPSLALIKYWGKSHVAENLPATSSLAIGLKALNTETTLQLADRDRLEINGQEVITPRVGDFMTRLRTHFGVTYCFEAISCNNFPTAAGIASSSSGFAALAFAAAALLQRDCPFAELSKLARWGSASAARALFGGFTILEREAQAALSLYAADHWPELRVIVAIVQKESKKISSRVAMECARMTSPYYTAWLESAEGLYCQALQACAERDLSRLGPLMQQSYLQMFATMWSSSPPTLYWEPDSLALMQHCAALRQQGFAIWETMDAGPQVKMVCLEAQLEQLLQAFRAHHPHVQFLSTAIANGPQVIAGGKL